MNAVLKFIPVAALAIGAAAGANAQERPSRAEMRTAIESLGVAPRDFRGCALEIRDDFGTPAEGGAANPERRAALLTCLQASNPDLTEEVLIEAFSSLRPPA